MKLLEHESKKILADHGIPILEGYLIQSSDEVDEVADKLGFPVQSLLIEEKLPIEEELYLGITVDNSRKQRVMLITTLGRDGPKSSGRRALGSDLPTLSEFFHQSSSLPNWELAYRLDLPSDLQKQMSSILGSLYEISLKYDATLAEINLLVLTEESINESKY